MRTGISTASFFGVLNVEDAVVAINDMGSKNVELFLNTTSEYSEDFAGMLCSRISARQMRVTALHPMGTQFEPQLFSLSPRQRRDAQKQFLHLIKTARALGAPYYVMHGPSNMRGMARNMQLDRIGPMAAELCEMAAEQGVTLTWENVSWCLFDKPEFAARILDASKSELMRFTLDVKQAMRSGFDALDYLKYTGERTVNVHLCDYYKASNDGLCMPFTGGYDFEKLFSTLKGFHYKGCLTIEVYSDLYRELGEVKDCFQRLNELAAAF